MDNPFVARGHTIIIDQVAHGPGAPVTLDPAEAKRLGELGFLSDTPPEPDTAQEDPADNGP